MFTYLLGAGASANCVPIVDKFQNDFNLLQGCNFTGSQENIKEAEEEIKKFRREIRDYGSIIEPHPTIDIFAKKLFLKKDPPNLVQLKKWLTVFFNAIQYARPIDERYVKFFASLIDPMSNSLPNDINIITWNYDFQLELAAFDFNRYNLPHLDSIHKYLSMFPRRDYLNRYNLKDDNVEERFTVTRLNGSALLYYWDNSQFKPFFRPDKISAHKTTYEGGGEDLIFDIEVFNLIIKFIYQYDDYEKNGRLHELYKEFTYCWEGDDIAKLALQRALKIARMTTELYVIGYSFPFVNRNFDDEIFKSMHRLERIIIQDPYMDQSTFNYIESRLKSLVPANPGVKVYHNDFEKEFILPG